MTSPAEYAAARNAEKFLGDYREVEPVRGGQLKWSEGQVETHAKLFLTLLDVLAGRTGVQYQSVSTWLGGKSLV